MLDSILQKNYETPIYKLGFLEENNLYIKRDDLYPFSFGGNKARKGLLFWKDLKSKNANYIVTYGSSSSNHCRVVSNIASSERIPCIIISPIENNHETYNKKMMEKLGSKILFCEVSKVKETIEMTINQLKEKGYTPYFIPGGGHGNIGTQAYVNCYEEIKKYEIQKNIFFDYIFFASGTGTTQAGLVCGKLLNNDYKKIIGISIARKTSYGKQIIISSILEYLDNARKFNIENELILDDGYILDGYGKSNEKINHVIFSVIKDFGIPLDETYTGKAFWGMKEYIKKNRITNKNILFIHTGGTPLFFDYLKKGI